LILKLNDKGKVTAWPHRIQILLVDYFDCQFRGEWTVPQTLLDWIHAHFARIRPGDAYPGSFAPLIVRLPAKHLTVSFSYTPGKPAYLTFDETVDSGDSTKFQDLGLTPRQSEILAWVAAGKRDSEIAKIIGSSTRTVSNHVHRLLRKLGVETRTAAVAEAQFRLRRRS
jgi:DNA-binding CsgD family transcriptional regulator